MSLYENIKKLAALNNINIAILERECNLSHGSIMKWAYSSPKSDSLAKIADYFNVSIDFLMERNIKENPLTEQEQKMLSYFRKCDSTKRDLALAYMEGLSITSKK